MGWFVVPPLGLTRAERTALFAGVLLIAAFFLTYLGYVLVGHSVLRVFYQTGVTTRNVADLTDWLGRGDRAFDYFFGRRLLAGAGLGAMLVCWSMRRTELFDDIRAFWRVSAGAPRAVFIGLLGLVVAGHYLDRNRELFPFVRWGMYTGVFEPAQMNMFDLYAVTAGGERHLVNIGRTLPSIHRGAPRAFSEYAGRRSEDDDTAATTGPVQNLASLDETALAVARLYADLHGLTLEAAEVVEEIVHRDAPAQYYRSSRLIRHIDVAAGTAADAGRDTQAR